MNNFIVIEKDSLNKVSVNAERIVLSESSIVHTKMNRDDVAEFIRDGNNLILKLTNGEVVVIENLLLTIRWIQIFFNFIILIWIDRNKEHIIRTIYWIIKRFKLF